MLASWSGEYADDEGDVDEADEKEQLVSGDVDALRWADTDIIADGVDAGVDVTAEEDDDDDDEEEDEIMVVSIVSLDSSRPLWFMDKYGFKLE